jgi:hypothetical protein
MSAVITLWESLTNQGYIMVSLVDFFLGSHSMEWLLGKRCNCTDWLYNRAKKENYIEILFFHLQNLNPKKLMFNCYKLLTRSREVPLRICTYAACCSLAHSKFDKGSRFLHWQGIGKWIWDSSDNSNSWFPFDALSLLPPKLLPPLLMDAHICFLMNYCCLYMQAPTLNPQVATKSINLKLWVDLTKCSFPMHTQTHNTFSQPILPQDLMRLSNTLSVRVAPRSSPVDQTNPILVFIP